MTATADTPKGRKHARGSFIIKLCQVSLILSAITMSAWPPDWNQTAGKILTIAWPPLAVFFALLMTLAPESWWGRKTP